MCTPRQLVPLGKLITSKIKQLHKLMQLPITNTLCIPSLKSFSPTSMRDVVIYSAIHASWIFECVITTLSTNYDLWLHVFVHNSMELVAWYSFWRLTSHSYSRKKNSEEKSILLWVKLRSECKNYTQLWRSWKEIWINLFLSAETCERNLLLNNILSWLINFYRFELILLLRLKTRDISTISRGFLNWNCHF